MFVDNEARMLKREEMEYDHIRTNQPDLEYQISLIDGEIAQIFAINHKDRDKCGRLIMQCIENQITKEARYLAEQAMEEI